MGSTLSPAAQVKISQVNPFYIGNIIVDEDDISKVISLCDYYNFSLSDSTISSCTFTAPDRSTIVYQHPIRPSTSTIGDDASSNQTKVKVSIEDNKDSLKDMLFKCGFRKKNGTYSRKSAKKKGVITYSQTKSRPKTLLFTYQPTTTE